MSLNLKITGRQESQTDWESFFCNVNGSLSSIFVDLELAKSAPKKDLPKLAWLWIRLNDPRDDGLSRDEEFEALCRYEDDLAALMNERGVGCYVGRITTGGRREFYFYIHAEVDFREIVEPVLEKHQDYLFQSGEKLDSSWSHYFDLLYPGENGMDQIVKRREKNNDV